MTIPTEWTVVVEAENEEQAEELAKQIEAPCNYAHEGGEEWTHDISEWWPNVSGASVDVSEE